MCNSNLFCTCLLPGIHASILINWPDTGNTGLGGTGNLLAQVLTLPLVFTHSAFQVDIIVDIRPAREDPEVVKNLVLILKCKKSVNWVIKSFDVKGNLKVIVSWPISWSCQTAIIYPVVVCVISAKVPPL